MSRTGVSLLWSHAGNWRKMKVEPWSEICLCGYARRKSVFEDTLPTYVLEKVNKKNIKIKMSGRLTTKSPECAEVHKLGAPSYPVSENPSVRFMFLENCVRSSVARTTRTPQTACRLEASFSHAVRSALKLRALRPLGASRHLSSALWWGVSAPGERSTDALRSAARRSVRSTRLEEPATSFAFLLPLPCKRSQPITDTTGSSRGGPNPVKVVHRVNELINSYV